jgi:hypothetical protein
MSMYKTAKIFLNCEIRIPFTSNLNAKICLKVNSHWAIVIGNALTHYTNSELNGSER